MNLKDYFKIWYLSILFKNSRNQNSNKYIIKVKIGFYTFGESLCIYKYLYYIRSTIIILYAIPVVHIRYEPVEIAIRSFYTRWLSTYYVYKRA